MKQNIDRKDGNVVRHFLRLLKGMIPQDVKSVNVNLIVFHCVITFEEVSPLPGLTIVVTTGIKPSSNISSALVSAMCGRSSELGLYKPTPPHICLIL